MAIRGENVGTAYVRIIADGSGIPRDIKDALNDAEPLVEQEGEDQSKAYQKGFRKGLIKDKKKTHDSLVENFAIGRGRVDGIAETLSSDFVKKLRTELRKAVGGNDDTIADTIFDRLVGDFRRSGNKDIFAKGLRDLPRLIDTAVRDIQRVEDAAYSEALRANEKFDREVERQERESQRESQRRRREMLNEAYRMDAEYNRKRRDLLNEAYRMDAQFDRKQQDAERRRRDMLAEAYQMDAQFDRRRRRLDQLAAAAARANEKRRQEAAKRQREMLALAYRMDAQHNRQRQRLDRQRVQDVRSLTEEYARLAQQVEALGRGEAEAGVTRARLRRVMRDLTLETGRLGQENEKWLRQYRDLDRTLVIMSPRLRTLNFRLTKIADGVGTAFGRGSRNDFLNFFGSITRNATRLIFLLPRMTQSFVELGRNVGVTFRKAGGGFEGLLAVGGLLTKNLAGVATSLASVGIAVGALALVLPPVIAGVSLLAGVLTALLGSLTFAAIGALGAVVGLLVPLAAGAGVAAIALTGLSDAMKETLKADVKPVVDSFKDLRDSAREGLFSNLAEQAREFSGVLDGFEPTFRAVGKGLSNIADDWIDSMQSPQFERFRDSMEKFLPDAVESLGRSFGNLAGGLGGLLRGMVPFLNDTLTWLEGITQQFSDWANSARGQNSIKTFFEDAQTSLSAVNDFLGSARDLFAELLDAGRGAGDTLFGDMSDALDRWTQAIRDNPDILGDWFDSSVKFGRALGRLIEGVGELFDVLDNPTSRAAITVAFEALAGTFELLSDAAGLLAAVLGPLFSLFQTNATEAGALAVQVGAAALAFPRLNRAADNARGNLTTLRTEMRDTQRRASLMAGAFKGAAGIGGLVALQEGASQSNKAVGTLLTTAGGAATGFAIGGPWGAAIGGAAGLMLGLADNTDKTAEAMEEAKPPTVNYVDTLDRLSGAATRATREMVLLELQERGVVDTARDLGLSSRDLVDSVLGVGPGVKRTADQMETLGKRILETDEGFGDLSRLEFQGAFGDLRRELGLTEQNLRNQQDALVETAGATEPLRKVLKNWPKDAITEIKTEGIPTSLEGVEQLAEKFRLTPKKVKTLIQLSGVDVNDYKMGELLDKARKWSNSKPKTTVTADTRQAQKNMEDVNEEIDKVGKSTPSKPLAKLLNAVGVDLGAIKRSVTNGKGETNRTLGQIGDVRADFGALRNSISDGLSGLEGTANSGGARVGSQIGAGIDSGIGGWSRVIQGTAAGIVNAAEQAARNAADSRSPSRLFMRVGDDMGRGLELGFRPDLTGTARRAVEAAALAARGVPAGDAALRLRPVASTTAPVAAGGISGRHVTVDGITVITQTQDPVAVANEVINHIVASGY